MKWISESKRYNSELTLDTHKFTMRRSDEMNWMSDREMGLVILWPTEPFRERTRFHLNFHWLLPLKLDNYGCFHVHVHFQMGFQQLQHHHPNCSKRLKRNSRPRDGLECGLGGVGCKMVPVLVPGDNAEGFPTQMMHSHSPHCSEMWAIDWWLIDSQQMSLLHFHCQMTNSNWSHRSCFDLETWTKDQLECVEDDSWSSRGFLWLPSECFESHVSIPQTLPWRLRIFQERVPCDCPKRWSFSPDSAHVQSSHELGPNKKMTMGLVCGQHGRTRPHSSPLGSGQVHGTWTQCHVKPWSKVKGYSSQLPH